jgi:site-specific DNA-methyltransferase (adenine-specific)
VELAAYCIKLANLKPGEVVLDPFMSTGATLLAAAELDVKAVGIEIDPAYCAAARRRLSQDAPTTPSHQPQGAEISAQRALVMEP